MRFVTPRKAALGMGAARSGTADHWFMTVTGVALALLTPLAMICVARAIGGTQAEVVASLGRPIPAAILMAFFAVAFRHWMTGTKSVIDDYVHGPAREAALIAVQIVGWALIALAVVAIGRMAVALSVI